MQIMSVYYGEGKTGLVPPVVVYQRYYVNFPAQGDDYAK